MQLKHNLLRRQFKKYMGDDDNYGPELRQFIETVDQSYLQADEDREMVERSLELSSEELLCANMLLQNEIAGRRKVQAELVNMNKILKDKTAQLEGANEEIKRFAYIVSHDLRAPLVNLKGFSGELRFAIDTIRSIVEDILPYIEGQKREEFLEAVKQDIPEALEFINSSTTRMEGMISAILKLSRLGRRELKLETLNMNEIVREILGSLQHQIDSTNITVSIEDLPEVNADMVAMEQIMGNLIGNAIKYLETNRPGVIQIKSEKGANEVVFHVIDNGRGIAECDVKKIFELFGRAGRQDKPGEGMGLTYARAMVKRHGGKICCKSKPGEGSTFSFSIPLKKINEGGVNDKESTC